MRYWLTTQWPPRKGEKPYHDGYRVWLSDRREQAGARLRRGDMVLIYQARSGRIQIRQNADCTEERIPTQAGREGIIAICRATEGVAKRSDVEPENYVDGTAIWWRWCASLELLSSSGFVPRVLMNRVLGYADGYVLRGFGERHSGLAEISDEQFRELASLFRGQLPKLPKFNARGAAGQIGEGGGESAEHAKLKGRVAQDPSTVLGEAGLALVAEEYLFPTGDRADLVLSDAFGRIIGVEIEVEVQVGQPEGLLQAIKYRRMLELVAGKNPGDSRSMLIAYRIAKPMAELAGKYGIECFRARGSSLVRVRPDAVST